MAVSAAVLSVPFGFVRWNLASIAPLVWWQLGLSTAAGTAAAMPLIAALTLPAAKNHVGFSVLARASFGIRGAVVADAGRGLLGLVLFSLITLAGLGRCGVHPSDQGVKVISLDRGSEPGAQVPLDRSLCASLVTRLDPT
jgi:hypothetical protein